MSFGLIKRLITALAWSRLFEDAAASRAGRLARRHACVDTFTHYPNARATVTDNSGQEPVTFGSAQVESPTEAESSLTPTLKFVTAEVVALRPPSNRDETDDLKSTLAAKRGLAFNKAELCTPFIDSNKISWAWNWDSTPNGLDPDVEFVPTLWGPIDIHTNRWKVNVERALASGSTNFLSFNECDIANQCNLDAASAADAHVRYMNPYADKARIGAPSVSNSDIVGQGLDWLRDWVEACETMGCKFDFCNVHWYSPATATESLYDHVRNAARICRGRPVWLTEFAPRDDRGAELSPTEAASWLRDVLPMLDDLAELERYSYFMVADGTLNSGSDLSVAGEAYLS